MKTFLFTLVLILNYVSGFSQNIFPDFLAGTWKQDGKNNYERWDRLNENQLKGFSYTLKNDLIEVSEYLNISKSGNTFAYGAAVPGQNDGKEIFFMLHVENNTYVFANPDHDFPKFITYTLTSPNTMIVKVSDGEKKLITIHFTRVDPVSNITDTTIQNPHYDKSLAEKLRSDDYGMKGYSLVILKTGSNLSQDKNLINQSFSGHMKNIKKLVAEGKLIVAGPLGKNDKNYRGIFILSETDENLVTELLKTDPAIQDGFLDFEIYPWYGSAALPEYLPFSDKVWKISF